jgi:hypothetical protein
MIPLKIGEENHAPAGLLGIFTCKISPMYA